VEGAGGRGTGESVGTATERIDAAPTSDVSDVSGATDVTPPGGTEKTCCSETASTKLSTSDDTDVTFGGSMTIGATSEW
jgi:hypothetical protein